MLSARENRPMVRAPVGPHASSPGELKQQLEFDRRLEPYLLLRDGRGAQRIIALPPTWDRATVGRGLGCTVCLSWDGQVSRVHAQLERLGDDWTVVDEGLSRNGTFVNGDRLAGRDRLQDGDLIRFGDTEVAFRAPVQAIADTAKSATIAPPPLSEAQRRVLVALCRPYRPGVSHASPAANREIAAELVLSVEAVKWHVRALFRSFGVEDLPHNRKRARLVELAFETGAIVPRDLQA